MSKFNLEGEDRAVFSPQDALNYRRRTESTPEDPAPNGVILTHNPLGVSHILSLEDGRRDHYITEGLYPLGSKDGKAGLFMCGLGASHAAVVMEELIAQGSRNFLNIGIAGSLQENLNIGDIVVVSSAVRGDEGVSQHYLEQAEYVETSRGLTRRLMGALAKNGLSFTFGKTWTTDALYRETLGKVKKYQNEWVLTVEMETASLAAVAEFRGVEFAAAFVISDKLANEVWKPGFHFERTRKSLEKLHEAALDVF